MTPYQVLGLSYAGLITCGALYSTYDAIRSPPVRFTQRFGTREPHIWTGRQAQLAQVVGGTVLSALSPLLAAMWCMQSVENWIKPPPPTTTHQKQVADGLSDLLKDVNLPLLKRPTDGERKQ